MKKLITLFIALSFFSCDDGDFDVPAFEFTSTIQDCGEYILYITNSNSTEVLALTLSTAQINTEIGEVSYAISSTLEANYRIFEDGIGSDYFCQAIPPSTPKVLKELNAESGFINIITEEVLTDGVITGYNYTITLSELLFNDNDERIYFESLDFGVFDIIL